MPAKKRIDKKKKYINTAEIFILIFICYFIPAGFGIADIIELII